MPELRLDRLQAPCVGVRGQAGLGGLEQRQRDLVQTFARLAGRQPPVPLVEQLGTEHRPILHER